MSGRQIMTADEIRRATIRLSHEIVEKQAGTDGLLLIGIQRRGVPLSRRIAEAIAENEGATVPVGALDITFYRDDLSLIAQQPIVKGTATFYEAGYTAMRLPRGTIVIICGGGGCVERVINDYGPQSKSRIVDLYKPDFFKICGCPSWSGTTEVTVYVY